MGRGSKACVWLCLANAATRDELTLGDGASGMSRNKVAAEGHSQTCANCD